MYEETDKVERCYWIKKSDIAYKYRKKLNAIAEAVDQRMKKKGME